MPKFEVHKADDQPEDGAASADKEPDGFASAEAEEIALTMDNQEEMQKNLYLYEEDMKQMPQVSTFLKSVLSYHTTMPTEKEVEKSKKQKVKLGVVLGVYLPTIQHIFGVLMFVRLAYIVGSMGTIEAFAMVFMCCLTTFVTAISMSAIATNGVVQAGGSYFMISRNLGPECGGAVGICFYLANTFAVDLYILGAIEIFLQYMAPQMAYFGDIHENPWNNFRLYGTITLALLTLIVAVGVRFVSFFAPISLACVMISVLSIFVGAFVASPSTIDDVWICLVGERLMMPPANLSGYAWDSWCTKNVTGDIAHRYCEVVNGTSVCDPYFEQSEVQWIPGIPGMASGIIKDNLFSKYMKDGEVTPGVKGDHHHGEVVIDMTTSFITLCAIYFPSVTGIMTGSNMSGDLRDPQKSIPIGTILAQLTTSFVYLGFVLLFGSTTHGALLRDKFGESQGGSLLASTLAWPHYWVVLVGAFCSTLGAALQCLTSAPRLLQAIARDNILPFLDVFKRTTKGGEPIIALLLTALISEVGIIIASLDYVAPVIDVFFLMCYAFVNITCALQTLLRSPSWRPRFKYYHWSLSLLGVFLNLTLSIMAGWYYALSAFLIAAFIYKYIEYKGGEKEWGDGIQGLSMSAAQRALLKLEEDDPHTKNWRPQLLVMCKMTHNCQIKYRKMLNFASQLKAGKGLTICAAVMEGNYSSMVAQAAEVKETIKTAMVEEKVRGFAKVMVTKDIVEGINIAVQTIGLGGMRHNTVLVGWPYGWQECHQERSWKVFLDTVRAVNAKELALLVPRNINNFPHNKERLTGTIDIWWIVHDGGMLILISFLLKQHKVWKTCRLRLFTVAQITDNSIQLKKDLEMFLYQLRISAEVHVEEMYDSDISAYTYERTLDMEKRAKVLQELKLKNRRHTERKLSLGGESKHGKSPREIQEIVDATHFPKRMSVTSLSPQQSSPPTVTVSMADDISSNLMAEELEDAAGEEDNKEQERNSPEKEKDTLKTGNNSQVSFEGLSPSSDDDEKMVHFTFSPSDGRALRMQMAGKAEPEGFKVGPEDPAEGRLMRMHTAVKLNEAIRARSQEAELVIVNFPAPPAKLAAEENYMYYLEALTDNLHRVLMVRGSGKEVVTIFS